MTCKSPLFTSALELFAQAVELYATKRQRNFKFAILHLANAVELVLKDALVDLGQSIYRTPKETIGIWDAFRLLEQHGVTVPRKPHLELLIDDRNTIQHRFGFPNDQATFYYIDEVAKFLRQFLADRSFRFEEEIPNYLDPAHLPLIGLAATPKAKLTAMLDLSPATAVIEAYKDLEARLLSFASGKEEELPPSLARRLLPRILNALVQAQYIPNDASQNIEFLTKTRNAAAHGQQPLDAKQAVDVYLDLVPKLEKASAEGFRYHSSPEDSAAAASEIGGTFALSWIGKATPMLARLSLSRPPILPKEIDAQLLQHACQVLGLAELDEAARKALRAGFWKAVQASPSVVGATFALSWIGKATPELVRHSLSSSPVLPKEIDALLLQHASQVLGLEELDEAARKALRAGFWKAVQASPALDGEAGAS